MDQKSRKILVVDDSETNLILLEAVLEESGWKVNTASSVKQAMDMIHSEKPDLILLDLLMPRVDGYAMLDRLKANEDYKDIPVIVVSAVVDAKTQKTCLDKGACDYMPKPVDIDTLLVRVNEILDNPGA